MYYDKASYSQIVNLALNKKLDHNEIADRIGSRTEIVDLIVKMEDPKLTLKQKLEALHPLAVQVLAKKLIEDHDTAVALYVLQNVPRP